MQSGDAPQSGLRRSRRLVLSEFLARNARRCPDKVALVFGDQRRTFAELDERTNRLANALADRGVRRGDNIAVLAHDGLEIIEAFFGCQKLGVCPVPLNFRLAEDELRYILHNSGAVGIVAGEALAAAAVDACNGIETLRFHFATGAAPAGSESYEAALASASTDAPTPLVEERDLAFLMYTSGTTGRPKGAMLSHLNLVTNTLNWVHELQVLENDVWLSGLPLFHIGGLNGLLPFIYLGGTTVIAPSTGFDAGRTLTLLAQHQVTACCFVPTQWAAICAHASEHEFDTSRLRIALTGASNAPLSTLEQFMQTFPSVELVNAFGQTEMSSNTCFLKGSDAMRKIGSVGKPAINVEVRVIDDRGRDVAPGDVGEIVYRGPTVMQGYYHDEAATREAFAGGWFHSGDLVRVDDEGFIYVVDRKKDMIISGGENVYPAEIERVLHTHPAVAEAAVIGIDHPTWVETPLAIVVLYPEMDATEDELLSHCRKQLAGFKKPSGIVFVEQLPRNAAGKILKRTIREQMMSSTTPMEAA